MELLTFDADHGYAEGVMRGQCLSFIKEDQYSQMKNLTSLQELKSYLEEETDYASYFPPEQISLTTNSIKQALYSKLADEIDYLQCNSAEPLAKFFFYIRCPYMIDNIVNIIEGLKNKVDAVTLEAQANPLGLFPELKSIKVESDDFASLYEGVLIDTPISPYFLKFLEHNTRDSKSLNEIQAFFKETKAETVRVSQKKLWLEDFMEFCETLPPISAESMKEILEKEADIKSIQCCYNTLTYSKAERTTVRKQLLPACGTLYPDCYKGQIEADSIEALRDLVKAPNYLKQIVNDVQDPTKEDENALNAKTLEDMVFEEDVQTQLYSFDQQTNFACFYSFVKLKEQEIRNINWMAELIARKTDKNDRKRKQT